MAELIVDEKRRITLPKELGGRLGITSGSRLEVEQRGGEIVLKPLVPIKKPTEALWGLARSRGQWSPKKEAREAMANRKRLGK